MILQKFLKLYLLILTKWIKRYSKQSHEQYYMSQILTSKPTQRPSNGSVIYGLFLEGCRWDGNYLVESLSKKLFTG